MISLPFFKNSSLLINLAFGVLLISGAYILLLWSPNVLGKYDSSTVKIIIYTLPWVMLWPIYSMNVIKNRQHRLELILIYIVIILGILNTIFSDDPAKTYPPMRTLILTGVVVLWASMFLLTDQLKRDVFAWFCCFCLAIIAPVELLGYFTNWFGPGPFQIFNNHPIPLGTEMILLSPGPIHLLLAPERKKRVAGGILAFFGILVIFLAGKRGSILAVAAMTVVWMYYYFPRLRAIIITATLATIMLLLVTLPRIYRALNPQIPKQNSILTRLELFPFALYIWEKHPILGIGLRSYTHQKYLAKYHQWDKPLKSFPATVKKLQTFDDMYLTAFVELGTPMALTYFGLIMYILFTYYRKLQSCETRPGDWYQLLVFLGFAIHSMTYDSLLFPSVNWLFHVQLGLMASYNTASFDAETLS
jgi:O-antigen ligase